MDGCQGLKQFRDHVYTTNGIHVVDQHPRVAQYTTVVKQNFSPIVHVFVISPCFIYRKTAKS
jgi:hypothetical protein